MQIIKELGQHVTYARPAEKTPERRSLLCILRPDPPDIKADNPALKAIMYTTLVELFEEAQRDFPDLDAKLVHVTGEDIRFVPFSLVPASYNRLQPTYDGLQP